MDSPGFPLLGTCRCGRVGIELAVAPVMISACHCRGCQRMSASDYSLTARVPAGAFRVVRGETVRGGIKGPQLDHRFCPDCMTWMFTRIARTDAFINVRPTMFDDQRWSRPFIETMTAEKLPWVQTAARYSYVGFPPVEDYERLTAEFAAAR